MKKIILATCESKIGKYLRERVADVYIAGEASSQRELGELIEHQTPDVALISCFLPGPLEITVILEELKKLGIRPVFLCKSNDEDLITKAIEKGIYDLLVDNFGVKELLQAIRKANSKEQTIEYIRSYIPDFELISESEFFIEEPVFETEQQNVNPVVEEFIETLENSNRLSVGQPIVVAVTSGKGGVGKSTVSSNIGGYFIKNGLSTVIVDLDLQHGNLASMLKVKSSFNLLSWSSLSNDMNKETVLRCLASHSSGLKLIPSPVEYVGAIEADLVERIISQLKKYFDRIIIDLDGRITKSNLYALSLADDIFFVVSPDTSSQERQKKTLNKLCSNALYRIEQSKISVIVNDANQRLKSGDRQYISQFFHPFTVNSVLPFTPELGDHVDGGKILVLEDEKSKFVQGIQQMLIKYVPREKKILNKSKKKFKWSWLFPWPKRRVRSDI